MKIYVTRDGQVYFRNYRAEPKSLPFLMRNAMQEGAERKVYLPWIRERVISMRLLLRPGKPSDVQNAKTDPT